MYGCESWTVKKAQCWRTDAFELLCWRKLFRVPWTARRSNQSILKEISPEYPLEGLIWNWSSNTLATWCEKLTQWIRPSCWERLKAGGEGDDREWDGWMASTTQWTWVWASSGSWWWIRKPGVLQSMGLQRVRHDWVTELNWKSKSDKANMADSYQLMSLWKMYTGVLSTFLETSLSNFKWLQIRKNIFSQIHREYHNDHEVKEEFFKHEIKIAIEKEKN